MVRHPEDRFYGTVAKAAQSKAIREVINRSVSPALKKWLEDEARKITGKLLTEDQVNQIIAKFAGIGVSER